MNNLITFIKKQNKYIIFFMCFFLINMFFFYKSLSHSSANLKLVIVAFMIISIIAFYINYRQKNKNIEKQFVFWAIIIGVFYALVMPIGFAPDEANHFRRAYEISMGHLVSDKTKDGVGGRKLPSSINDVFSFKVTKSKYKDVSNIVKKSNNNKKKDFQTFANTSLYSAICYLPQTIGILIGRLLHLPMLFIVYLARLFNLAIWIAIIYFAIKRIPISKYTLMLIAFAPISMQAAASCQADAVTNAVAFALIAITLSKIKTKTKITKKEGIIISFLAILMSMCKIVYIPICLLLFLIPKECFNNNKDKFMKIGLLALFVVLINIIWLAISSTYLVEFQSGVNSSEQVKLILTHPIYYANVLFSTYNQNFLYYYMTSLGQYLGYFHIQLSDLYIFFYSIFIMYTFICENSKNKLILDKKSKLLIIFIIVVCILLISTSLYVQWTAVGANLISGIQGRYFIPLIPMALLLLNTKEIDSKKDNVLYVCMLICMINIYALETIVAYYM